MSWAKVGMKVVCVKPRRGTFHIMPVCDATVGAVYTIRDIYESEAEPGEIGVRLEEIVNATSPKWGIEYGFYLDRFRPFISKHESADVAMFKRIAETAPSLEDAE